jgi:hypothetical protein
MIEEFFDIILNKIEFEWKLEYFDNILWSKNNFEFSILEKIMNNMHVDNFTKLNALLSWLKNDKENKEEILYNFNEDYDKYKEKENDYNFNKNENYNNKETKEFFYVRYYIKKSGLVKNINSKEIIKLKNQHCYLTSIFDLNEIIDKYILCNSKLIFCLVCNETFSSPFELKENLECKSEFYHPRYFDNLDSSFSLSNNSSSNLNLTKDLKNICLHEGCKKKQNDTEFNCCHKSKRSKGCTYAEGNHQLVIIDNFK